MKIESTVARLTRLLLMAALGACTQDVQAHQSTAARVPTKWALLIGIDRYRSPEVNPLRGAANDVERMKHLLVTKFEFPEQHVMVLTNEQATHAAIVRAIQQHLIANAQKGDIVVIHFSGHGSQMRDISGDETDGMDETLVANDSRLPNIFDISDDEINGLLTKLGEKTDNVTLILDSCHSGTGMRAAGIVRAAPPDMRDPPSPPEYARSVRGSDPARFRQSGVNFVLLAAARSDQLSYEYDQGSGTYGGAFTFFLTEELARAGAGATYRDIMDHVRDQMASRYGRQDPQLEGAGEDVYVFSDSTSIADPYFAVSPLMGRTVRLGGGAIHGLTAGSILEVYPAGTKHFTPPAVASAKLEITRVESFTSEAKILGAGSVAASSRAVEREHVYPDRKLRVYYRGKTSSPTLRAIREKLVTSNNIQERLEPLGYDLLVREEAGQVVFEASDTMELSPRVSARAGNVDNIAAAVQRWARWFNLLAIDNPLSTLSVNLTLPANRQLFDGDSLTMTITNHSEMDLYIAILDLSSDGSVGQAFPDPDVGGAQLIPAGQTKPISLGVWVPENRSAVKDILKVFAATTALDLRPLTQPPIVARDAFGKRGPTNPLEELLAQSAVGVTRQAGRRVSLTDWLVKEGSITVKRRPGT